MYLIRVHITLFLRYTYTNLSYIYRVSIVIDSGSLYDLSYSSGL